MAELDALKAIASFDLLADLVHGRFADGRARGVESLGVAVGGAFVGGNQRVGGVELTDLVVTEAGNLRGVEVDADISGNVPN